jgi:hypothetical protein
MRKSRSFAILAALLAAQAALAQTEPVPVQQDIPEELPTTQFGTTMEGWVKVRYSVLANGTTANVRVVEVMPPRLDTRATVAAVERWTFQAASPGAPAAEWHDNEAIVTFDDPATPLEPTPFFLQSYTSVSELLGAKDFEKARDAANQRLPLTARLNEIGLTEAQVALASIGLADYHAAYAAIKRATDPSVVTLPDEQLRKALEVRFAVELELGRAADALATYARHRALLPSDGSAEDALAGQAQALEKSMQTDAPIAVKGRIEREPWAHVPARRTFTLTDVEGEVSQIQVECDRRKTVLTYQADVDWTLPAGWGSCTLFVDGKRDTTFALYEFK